jgi:zinc protease
MEFLELIRKSTSLYKLPNGVCVILRRRRAPVVSIRVHVGVGSVHDGPVWGSGKAHLLEHVIYSRTNTLCYMDLEKFLDSLGGGANAYTTEESTAYFITVRKGKEFTAIDLLSDMLLSRSFNDEEVEREKDIIIEESKLDEEDVEQRLYKSFKKRLYVNHPLKFPVEGEPQLLEKLKAEDLNALYSQYYVPENMVIVISGSFDEEKILSHLERNFGMVPSSPLPPNPSFNEPYPSRFREFLSPMKSDILAHGLLGFKTVSLLDKGAPYIEIMWASLTEGESSPLNRYIRERERLIHHYEAWSFFPSCGPGYVALYFVTERSKFEDARKAILNLIFNYKPDRERVSKVIKILRRDFYEDIVTIDGEGDLLGGDLIRTGDPFFSFNYLRRMEEIEDIQNPVDIFTPQNLTEIYVVPSPPKIRRIKFGEGDQKIIFKRVGNGLSILYIRENLPNSYFQIHLRGGSLYETKPGLSYIYSKILLRGPKDVNPEEFYEIIESEGGDFDVDIGNHILSIKVTAPLNDKICETILNLFRKPRIDEDTLKWAQEETINEIKEDMEDWQEEAIYHLRKALFGNHPYGRHIYGKSSDVKKINIFDLIEWKRKLLNPKNIVIAGAGPEPFEEFLACIGRRIDFKSEVELPSPPKPPHIRGEKRILRSWKRNESMVLVGFRGSTLDSEDRAPLDILSGFLGGTVLPGGWLHTELRNRGSSYFSHSIHHPGEVSGYFVLCAATRNSNIEEIEGIIMEIVERIKRGEFGEEDIERGKEGVLLSISLKNTHIQSKLEETAKNILLGLGYDYDRKFEESLKGVDVARVKEVVERYLNSMRVVVLKPEV